MLAEIALIKERHRTLEALTETKRRSRPETVKKVCKVCDLLGFYEEVGESIDFINPYGPTVINATS